MMRDLYSDLPTDPCWSNYATRLAHHWITGDPGLTERCLECADEHATLGLARVAEQIRALVVSEALLAESRGVFFDLFTEGLREVQWSEFAEFYLDSVG
jgi:hypothetical protein